MVYRNMSSFQEKPLSWSIVHNLYIFENFLVIAHGFPETAEHGLTHNMICYVKIYILAFKKK